MQQYGIDGVFVQRFFDMTRTEKSRAAGRIILGHALKASQKNGRALAVMYDLSGLKPGEDCSSLIEDVMIAEAKLSAAQKAEFNSKYFESLAKPTIDEKRRHTTRIQSLIR